MAVSQMVQNMSGFMEDLRERLAASQPVGERVPLDVHLKSMGKGLERLQDRRVHVSGAFLIDISTPIDISAPVRVNAGVLLDMTPLPTVACGTPTSHLHHTDTTLRRSRIDADIQIEDHGPTLSPPTDTWTTTSRVDADVRAHEPTPMRATSYVGTGIQGEDPSPPIAPSSPPDALEHSPHIQASTQTVVPRASASARARISHEIQPDLLRKVVATASARGKGACFKEEKHMASKMAWGRGGGPAQRKVVRRGIAKGGMQDLSKNGSVINWR
ncbi:hypothetical protein EWM64_g8087 [Hericium alpestre]|uniref:Uncharacterized protein n=1 Tax=Hericium alpestre TaxID=135208 RepID=A0A4Y9ZMS0_9AGAM|nr:hypothetical protein EWM64_g8087 [Hericium alpestre]